MYAFILNMGAPRNTEVASVIDCSWRHLKVVVTARRIFLWTPDFITTMCPLLIFFIAKADALSLRILKSQKNPNLILGSSSGFDA